VTAKLNFVSAGAGSGKTYRLTQILHEQLSRGSARPSGIIATTFTRKAATELRERVRLHLLRQGDYVLANAMGQARIGTVNSVCGALLERFAFEAGLATEQQVLEESQAMLLVKQSLDSVLDGPKVSELIRIAARMGIEEWQADVKDLLDKARANDIPPEMLAGFATENAGDLLSHLPKPTQQGLSAALHSAIALTKPALESAAGKVKAVKKTTEYLELVRRVERGVRGNDAPWSDWVKLSKELPEAGLKSVAETIAAVAGRYAEHPGLHADIESYLARVFTLGAEALRIYGARKREMGALDFTDQEHLLLKVLDDESVAATLGEELDLLLVDEFQDTSPIQLALFLKLARHAKAVYWVGDIKQAIYGFRGSDTALMEASLKALTHLGGTKEILSSSWRSRAPLVALVNEVFRSAFSETLAPEEVELKVERNEALPEPAFANWLLGGSNKEQEVSALAAGIRQLVNSSYSVFDKHKKCVRAVNFGDMAILCRSNAGVTNVAAGLRRLAVPATTEQPGLLQTPEAVLALACLRRLNDPSDTIATAEILSLADCEEPESWVADRLKYLAAGGEPDSWREQGASAHPLIARLARMRASLSLLAPREAVQAVITECELSSRVLRWKQDPTAARVRLANLEAMLALADQYEDICRSAQHAGSISGLILWLREQADNGQDNLAVPAIDAVKVMTHHAAKGLEWPVVLLMDLSTEVKDRLWSITAVSRSPIDVADPLKDRFIRYWPWPFGKQKNVTLADDIALTPTAEAFRKSAVEESKRLLYVSMTRARDLLILVRSQRKPTGAWINTLGAPWLLPDGDNADLSLPSGETIAGFRWVLDQVEPNDGAHETARPMYWFRDPDSRTERRPLVFNPSAAEAPRCVVTEKARIGERIDVANGSDMAALGTAIHACIAATFTDRNAPLSVEEVEAILNGHGVGECVTSGAVLSQIGALHGWIASTWDSPAAYAEIPVESVLETGQVINGRIDLLLEVEGGWVLLDHKSSAQGADQWDRVAQEYAGQLDAYKRALERATRKPVLESWLFFPVAAGAVRIELS
jgi:ATP-dependent exoDNAse (exonuclease V) beta subunit